MALLYTLRELKLFNYTQVCFGGRSNMIPDEGTMIAYDLFESIFSNYSMNFLIPKSYYRRESPKQFSDVIVKEIHCLSMLLREGFQELWFNKYLFKVNFAVKEEVKVNILKIVKVFTFKHVAIYSVLQLFIFVCSFCSELVLFCYIKHYKNILGIMPEIFGAVYEKYIEPLFHTFGGWKGLEKNISFGELFDSILLLDMKFNLGILGFPASEAQSTNVSPEDFVMFNIMRPHIFSFTVETNSRPETEQSYPVSENSTIPNCNHSKEPRKSEVEKQSQLESNTSVFENNNKETSKLDIKTDQPSRGDVIVLEDLITLNSTVSGSETECIEREKLVTSSGKLNNASSSPKIYGQHTNEKRKKSKRRRLHEFANNYKNSRFLTHPSMFRTLKKCYEKLEKGEKAQIWLFEKNDTASSQ